MTMTAHPMKLGRILLAGMIVFVFLVVPFAVYTVGYFAFGDRCNWSSRGIGYTDRVPIDLVEVERSFPKKWLQTTYLPAGRLEQWMRGIDVTISSYGEPEIIEEASSGMVDQVLVEVGDP